MSEVLLADVTHKIVTFKKFATPHPIARNIFRAGLPLDTVTSEVL